MNRAAKALALCLVVVIGITTAPEAAPQERDQGSSDKPCNAAATAIGGALIGALLGGKRGAAIGGALGGAACLAANYHAKKIRSAQEVDADYERSNGGHLPEHATLVDYQARIDPQPRVQPGESSALASYIEVAQGADGVTPKIEEEITLLGPDGKPLKTVRKPANEGETTGAFETRFAFTLPKGVREGQYRFHTTVYLNGENVREQQIPLQVVNAGST